MYYFNYLDRFSSNPHILNFMNIRQVGAELFLAGRQTDRHKLIVVFRKVMKPSKKFKRSSYRTLTPKTLFWLLWIHGAWVADGTDETSAEYPSTYKQLFNVPPTLESRRRKHKRQVCVKMEVTACVTSASAANRLPVRHFLSCSKRWKFRIVSTDKIFSTYPTWTFRTSDRFLACSCISGCFCNFYRKNYQFLTVNVLVNEFYRPENMSLLRTAWLYWPLIISNRLENA